MIRAKGTELVRKRARISSAELGSISVCIRINRTDHTGQTLVSFKMRLAELGGVSKKRSNLSLLYKVRSHQVTLLLYPYSMAKHGF